MYGTVGGFLLRFDASGDGALDKAELATAEQQAQAEHGERGPRLLRQYAAAADVDRDGRLTLAEWEALGERVGAVAGVARETVMLPMADGVKLATEIWRPSQGGPFPVILQRTPYGRDRHAKTPGPVRQGYAVVTQDMRGRFDSEGENLPFIGCGWQGHQDGADTVRWLLQQPWCNGKIGTEGGSAGGITQNLLAGTAPAGLVCQRINVAAASLYHHAAYVGGALRQCQIDKWLSENKFSPEALALYRAHPSYDEFWQAFDSTRRHEAMTVPAMHVGGWFDTFSLGTVTSFVGRQEHGGPGAKGRQVLIMGPWAHGGFRDGGKVGELTFPRAREPAEYSAGRWFEHYLKGVANGVETLKPVTYYVMGAVDDPAAPGNLWRTADTWPPPGTQATFYLTADRRLVSAAPTATGPETALSYTFDPQNPCPTRGGGNLTIPAGPMDQRPAESRPDVLCFSTEPLLAPLETTGQITASLFLASSAVDTDLSLRFCDVYPDGRSFLMAEGMLRVRFREGVDHETLMTPGTVYPLQIEFWPTSVVINQGHRLRLTVTSSNHPRFDVNPGTGKPWAAGEPTQTQRNTLYCDAAHPSRIVLPVPAAPKP
jgi:predicted acyl esterase